MVQTQSTMLELGTPAPDFDLADANGVQHRLADFAGADALIVAFISNHCPFVKHIKESMAGFAREYTDKNVAMVAINANNVVTHPGDSPERMREDISLFNYVFPYLYDESQTVATAYRAACTPEFYLFDKQRKLAYRGQYDDARPGNDVAVTGKDLRRAADALLDGRRPSSDQVPSVGCNIKWKPGNEPDY